MKYGVKASSGGGRSSARETIGTIYTCRKYANNLHPLGRVASGAVAEKYLRLAFGVEIVAMTASIGQAGLSQSQLDRLMPTVSRADVDSHPTRCRDPVAAEQMTAVVMDARDKQDSIGGTVVCVVRNVPVGLGEPCFDKLEAKLAHAMLSIPATKVCNFKVVKVNIINYYYYYYNYLLLLLLKGF
jgi:chorismate synthase